MGIELTLEEMEGIEQLKHYTTGYTYFLLVKSEDIEKLKGMYSWLEAQERTWMEPLEEAGYVLGIGGVIESRIIINHVFSLTEDDCLGLANLLKGEAGLYETKASGVTLRLQPNWLTVVHPRKQLNYQLGEVDNSEIHEFFGIEQKTI